jgi:UDP-glucose 4-epimerase
MNLSKVSDRVNIGLPNKNILIIGGSGFIGTNLAEYFLRAGCQVTVADINPLESLLRDRCNYFHCDLRRVASNLLDVLSNADFVIYLAGLLGKRCVEEPANAWSTNVGGLCNVLQGITKISRMPEFYFFSSSRVYKYNIPLPINEHSLTEGSDLYSHSKLVGESMIRSMASVFGLKAVILRPFTVYGSGPAKGSQGHFVAKWIEQALNGETLSIYGDGQQTIDLVHVSDLVIICKLLMERNIASVDVPVFNIASGHEITIRQKADWIKEIFPEVNFQYLPNVQSHFQRQQVDLDLIQEQLGFSPQVHPKKGLQSLWMDLFSLHSAG